MTYKAVTKKLLLKTKKRLHFINITKQVEEVIHKSGIVNGSVIVQTHHTTCSVWVNEDEKNLIGHEDLDCEHDLKRVLDRFAHPDEEYGHNDIKDAKNPKGKRDTHLCEPDEEGVCHECINGHAHAQAMILPHSITMIVKDGELIKGEWQQIMICELDHDREREVTVLVQGTY
ncbi:YjbQ family protein [Candidatus Woesearchaeota archaeon]|nr:YjbQ family protein [Candidatus Woesearchaeota archaeon]